MFNLIRNLFLKSKTLSQENKNVQLPAKKIIKSQNLKNGDKFSRKNISDLRVGKFVSLKDSDVLEVIGSPHIKKHHYNNLSVLVHVKVLSENQFYNTQVRFCFNHKVELNN